MKTKLFILGLVLIGIVFVAGCYGSGPFQGSVSDCGEAVKYIIDSDKSFLVVDEGHIVWDGKPFIENNVYLSLCTDIKIYCYNETKEEILNVTGKINEGIKEYISFKTYSSTIEKICFNDGNCIDEKVNSLEVCK